MSSSSSLLLLSLLCVYSHVKILALIKTNFVQVRPCLTRLLLIQVEKCDWPAHLCDVTWCWCAIGGGVGGGGARRALIGQAAWMVEFSQSITHPESEPN